MKRNNKELAFEIDKLTNSIENVITGDTFLTQVGAITAVELKTVAKKNDWQFDWKKEYKEPARKIYKLTIVHNESVIQGLISVEVRSDHIYMHLLENAPFNIGKEKMYAGVAGNLVAFACKLSFDHGFEGNISFMAKTQLIGHYTETLGALHIGRQRMIIGAFAAQKLVQRYFPV